jgi:hypothetical protein
MNCKSCGKLLSEKNLHRKDRPHTGYCGICWKQGSRNHSWKGGKPKCVGCGNTLTNYRPGGRCKGCFHKFYKGENVIGWKGGKPKCKTCGKQLKSHYGKYCTEHKGILYSGENNYRWIPKRNCIECGKQLSRNANLKNSVYCKTCSHLGERSHRWQGGITKLSQSIRNSAKNKAWIQSIFKRDDYTCQICGQRGKKLHADHYPVTFAELFHRNKIANKRQAMDCAEFWDINNGRTLCVTCHKLTPTYLNNAHAKSNTYNQV